MYLFLYFAYFPNCLFDKTKMNIKISSLNQLISTVYFKTRFFSLLFIKYFI